VRAVLDSDVMVAAIRSRFGASRRLLIRALAGRFSLIISVPLMLEYEAVMTRTQHLKVAPDDEMVLETAVNGFADLIVTFNLRDFGWAPGRFGIVAVRPAEGIKLLKV